MSWIWNVMLSCGDDEYWDDDQDEALEIPRALEKINDWLKADKVHGYGPLEDLTIGAGGAGMNANVFGGGYKHFDIEAFIEVVSNQKWRDKKSVQLFLQGEEDNCWTILNFAEKSEE